MKSKIISIACIGIVLCTFAFVVITSNRQTNMVQVNSTTTLSNQKIEWGIKRAKNHHQPDLVKQMIDEGHIVGNHIPVNFMYLKERCYES